MPTDQGAHAAATRLRVAELDMIYGAMLGCLGPEPEVPRAEVPADRPDTRTIRARFQTELAPWFPHPMF